MGKLCKTISNRDLIILLMVISIQIMIIIAVGLESKAFDSDREWNEILVGNLPFSEDIRGEYFFNKTIDLDEILWGEEKEDLQRDGSLEIAYLIVIIIVFLALCVYHVLFFYWPPLRNEDKAKHQMTVLFTFMTLGVVLLIGFGMLTLSMSNIKGNIIGVHGRFVHKDRDKDQDYTDVELERMNEVLFFKDMLGICIRNFIYMDLNPTQTFEGGFFENLLLINGEDYPEDRLLELRFCPLEEFKVASLSFIAIGAFMCWLIAFTIGCYMRFPIYEEEEEVEEEATDSNPTSETSVPPAEPNVNVTTDVEKPEEEKPEYVFEKMKKNR